MNRRSGRYSRSVSRFGKKGVVLHDSAARLKFLFLKASTQVCKESLELFKTELNLSQESIQTELSIQRNGSEYNNVTFKFYAACL